MENVQDLQKKLQEALADEAFAKELFQMEDPGDVQKALEEVAGGFALSTIIASLVVGLVVGDGGIALFASNFSW